MVHQIIAGMIKQDHFLQQEQSMFFIAGVADGQKEISSGSFHCPSCGVTRHYKRMRAGRYFSLYFIPLFRVKDMGEYVECQTCKHIYRPEVLTQKVPSADERLVQSVRDELLNGLPLHMMIQKLIAQGVDQSTAEQLVQRACNGYEVPCSQCGFVYLKGVKRCFNCGHALE